MKRKLNADILSYSKGLRNGDKITFGFETLSVIETPGHSIDSICLRSHKNLFTGDTLFVGDSGMTLLKGSNRKDLGVSIRKLIRLFPGDTIVWPGHNYGLFPRTTLEKEQTENKNSEEYALNSVAFSSFVDLNLRK